MSDLDTLIAFRLVDMAVHGFDYVQDMPQEADVMHVRTELKWTGYAKEHLIACHFHLQYGSDDQVCGKLEIACQFEISEDSWESHMQAGDQTPRFPKQFLMQVAAVTVGAARGVLFEKTAMRSAAPMVLPLLDASKMTAGEPIWSWE